jgi:hypothetical protein
VIVAGQGDKIEQQCVAHCSEKAAQQQPLALGAGEGPQAVPNWPSLKLNFHVQKVLGAITGRSQVHLERMRRLQAVLQANAMRNSCIFCLSGLL